jgi:hypothetical protein
MILGHDVPKIKVGHHFCVLYVLVEVFGTLQAYKVLVIRIQRGQYAVEKIVGTNCCCFV